MNADWHASAHSLDYSFTVDVGPEKVGSYLQEKGEREGWVFSEFRDFQRTCGEYRWPCYRGRSYRQRQNGSSLTVGTRAGETRVRWKNSLPPPHHGNSQQLVRTGCVIFFCFYEHPVGLTHSMADLVTRHEQEQMDDAVGDGKEAVTFSFALLIAILFHL